MGTSREDQGRAVVCDATDREPVDTTVARVLPDALGRRVRRVADDGDPCETGSAVEVRERAAEDGGMLN